MVEHQKRFYSYYNYSIPKMHYRLHFPKFIAMYGVPRYFSTLLYENFHHILKIISPFTNNVNNSLLIMTKYMQYLIYGRKFGETNVSLSKQYEVNKFDISIIGHEHGRKYYHCLEISSMKFHKHAYVADHKDIFEIY